MGRSRILVAGMTLVLTVGLTGLANAHTEAFPTSITMKVSPTPPVEKGTAVTFSGKLSSDRAGCVKQSTVNLIKVGTGDVATTTTNNRGRYSFTRHVRATARWKVRFPGKVLDAVHPHNHTCDASTSSRVRVRVL